MNDEGTHYYGDGCGHPHGRVIHVGLPIAAAGTIEVNNVIHMDQESYVVTKVGGAAFDMVRIRPPSVTEEP